jgi:ribose 5-phosphate isomerase A
MANNILRLKQLAAERAVEQIESGMVIGLGSGSTATLAIQRIGVLLKSGKLRDIVGVPTSQASADEARKVGIPLTTLEEHEVVDLTVDGADEVDPQLNLIKGGGGALLREKIVAQSSLREIIIVDDSKLSPALGTNWPIPIEVVPFGWSAQSRFLEDLGAVPRLRLRANGEPFVTDHANYILDTQFGPLDDAESLACLLSQRTGIVEHGLFVDLTSEVIVAGVDGIRTLKPR